MYNSLERFMNAQERVYEVALKELKDGKKTSHWMWYIFPQLRGLGKSNTSFIYGIINISEAKEYLAHPSLGTRLKECCEAVLAHKEKTAEEIFGYIDDEKLRSCMTLFAYISEEDSVFHKVLESFFDSNCDEKTVNLISAGFHIENDTLMGYYGEEENLIIPEGVTSIHKMAFYKNKYLRSVVFPESLIGIGENAFSCCYNLENVVIPESVSDIGPCAFSCCERLSDGNGFEVVKSILYNCYNTDESVTVPDGVVTIGQYAFSARRKTLKTVVVPEGVQIIEPLAFWRCDNLKKVTIPRSVVGIALNAFKECDSVEIQAPSDSYAAAFARAKGIKLVEE
ncbi:MAG: DUF1810 family protein [Acutalibacteraceae bacterium]|nr:DUF1810 family protein [Acutalibacteraceae bacterium]